MASRHLSAPVAQLLVTRPMKFGGVQRAAGDLIAFSAVPAKTRLGSLLGRGYLVPVDADGNRVTLPARLRGITSFHMTPADYKALP